MTDQIDPRRLDWIAAQLREKADEAPGATRRGVMREAADLLTSLRQQVETLRKGLDENTERACRFNADAEAACNCPAHEIRREALQKGRDSSDGN